MDNCGIIHGIEQGGLFVDFLVGHGVKVNGEGSLGGGDAGASALFHVKARVELPLV